MTPQRPAVLVTGISGEVGRALLSRLAGFSVVGTGLRAPEAEYPVQFCTLDLQHEHSCMRLVELLRETHATAVVHLETQFSPAACLLRPASAWQASVAGTARVLEAIAEVNRSGGRVSQFVMVSGAAAYGCGAGRLLGEEARLRAEGWQYAVLKRESDEVVQFWAPSLSNCRTWILRPATVAHPEGQDSLLEFLRGVPFGKNRMAASRRKSGRRVPVVLPFGKKYLQASLQFVHAEDLARLIEWILRKHDPGPSPTVLNVAGRGEPVRLEQCIEMAGQGLLRLPGFRTCRATLSLFRKLGLCSLSSEGLPYLLAPPLLDTSNLRDFLGTDYRQIIQFTMEEALQQSFPSSPRVVKDQAALVSSS